MRLWKEWLLVNGALLVIFNVWDQAVLDREERERPGSQLEAVMEHEPLRVEGKRNFGFLLGIVADDRRPRETASAAAGSPGPSGCRRR